MSLINLTSIQDGDSADDTLFNSRYGIIVNEINGNLDADNLKDSAVTTPKLANASVTPVKMALSKTVDANGWTVYDYGTWKEYAKGVAFNISLTNLAITSHSLTVWPVGQTNSTLHYWGSAQSGWAYGFQWGFEVNTTHVIITIKNDSGGDRTGGTPFIGTFNIKCISK